ncbi:hypothetical protein [Corynebacterium caspium]|nr:hypothetical protein [Corynebacterium caspium]WKD58684.1 hypothetical protein CCASP_01290 [Corynebacterium caspium DSM 44850]
METINVWTQLSNEGVIGMIFTSLKSLGDVVSAAAKLLKLAM